MLARLTAQGQHTRLIQALQALPFSLLSEAELGKDFIAISTALAIVRIFAFAGQQSFSL
jgi:hypothetical protein